MIRILFFGSIADRLGLREQVLSAYTDITITDVVKAVGCDDFNPLLVAVNQIQIKDMNTTVKAGDEVALMPPFSGG